MGDKVTIPTKDSTRKPRRVTPSLLFWCVLLTVAGYVSLFSFNVANWYEHGFNAALETVQRHTDVTLSTLNLRNNMVEANIIAASQIVSGFLKRYGDATQSTLHQVVKDDLHQATLNTRLKNKMVHIEDEGGEVLVLLKLTFWQFSIKVMALVESIGVVVCASVVGAMDGLCKRYIRTSEGGRESTLLYHTAGKRFMLLPMSVILLYLALPIFISGMMATMALALCFFIYFNVRMSCLKKYL